MQLRVLFEREQHREDDRQRHQTLLPVDHLMHAVLVAHEDERTQEIRPVVHGARVHDVFDELLHLHVVPAVRTLERRNREPVVGGEHLGQRFFTCANRHTHPPR